MDTGEKSVFVPFLVSGTGCEGSNPSRRTKEVFVRTHEKLRQPCVDGVFFYIFMVVNLTPLEFEGVICMAWDKLSSIAKATDM